MKPLEWIGLGFVGLFGYAFIKSRVNANEETTGAFSTGEYQNIPPTPESSIKISAKQEDITPQEKQINDDVVTSKIITIKESSGGSSGSSRQYVPTYQATTYKSGIGTISATPTTYTTTSEKFTKLASSYGFM